MDQSYNILIVDDVSENIKVAINILKNDTYNFSYALSGAEAIEILRTKRFDIILLDIMMPGIDGYEVCARIKRSSLLEDVPVIFVTAKTDIESIQKGFELGAADYVTKPFHPKELQARVKNHLEFYAAKKQLKKHNISLVSKMQENSQIYLNELEAAQKEMIEILSDLLENRNLETASHVRRVGNIAVLLAQLDKRMSAEDIKILSLIAPLHDIGKIFIDDSILLKKGPLDSDEFQIMKEHSNFAYKVLGKSSTKLISSACSAAYEHHENYDGTGYPRGLVGEEISLYGRVLAIADVLDALTHERVYKKAWSFEEAEAYILENRGKKFDPKLVDAFIKNSRMFRTIVKQN